MEIKELPKCDCGEEAIVKVNKEYKVVITHCGVMSVGETYAEAYQKWVNKDTVPYEFDWDDLHDMFEVAKEEGCDIAVEVTIPNQEDTEIIVNRNKSIDNKLAYYEATYNDDLTNKNCQDIKIVDAFCIDTGMFDYDSEEMAYKDGVLFPATKLGFGDAIEAVKCGFKLAREGWNGKNQYIELATCVSYKNSDGEIVNVDHATMGNNAIAFVGTSGVQLGWLASQADLLSDDWYIVDGECGKDS